MINGVPNDVDALIRTAHDGARHTHVGDAPVQARFSPEDQAEIMRLFNAVQAGNDAVLIVRQDDKIRFFFSQCGVWKAIQMMRDVIRAKE